MNSDKIRDRVDAKYRRELSRSELVADSHLTNQQIHRCHAYSLFIAAAIMIATIGFAYWFFSVYVFSLTLIVAAIIIVAFFKLLLSFLPHKSPFDGC